MFVVAVGLRYDESWLEGFWVASSSSSFGGGSSMRSASISVGMTLSMGEEKSEMRAETND